jgi:hypothetical protein
LQTVRGGEDDETFYLVLLQSADLNCLHFGIAIGDGDHDAEANIRCGMVNGLDAAGHKVVGKKRHHDADDSGTVSLEPTSQFIRLVGKALDGGADGRFLVLK